MVINRIDMELPLKEVELSPLFLYDRDNMFSGLRNFFKRTLYAGFEFVELLDTISNSYPREKIKIYQSENIGCNL